MEPGPAQNAKADSCPTGNICSDNWSGNVDDGYGGQFNSVGAWYDEPAENYATCSPYQNAELGNGTTFNLQAHAYWVGLGGTDGNTMLSQAGTWTQYSSNPSTGYGDVADAYWWEIVPEYDVMFLKSGGQDIITSPGSEMEVAVEYLGIGTNPSDHQPAYAWAYGWYDYGNGLYEQTVGYWDTYKAQQAGYSTQGGNTAEFIDESPQYINYEQGLQYYGYPLAPNALDAYNLGLAPQYNYNANGIVVNGQPFTSFNYQFYSIQNPNTSDIGSEADPYNLGSLWEKCY